MEAIRMSMRMGRMTNEMRDRSGGGEEKEAAQSVTFGCTAGITAGN
jgi:hypothetical protein